MAAYYVRSGASGANNGTTKTDAYTTMAAALSGKAAGDVFYVASDHAESTAGAVTLTFPGTAAAPNYVYCVNFAGSTPPVSADLRTTATAASTGANVLSFSGFGYIYGIAFTSGSGSSAVNMTVGGVAGALIFDGCKLILGGTNTGNRFTFGGAVATRIVLRNTTVKFGATAQGCILNSCDFRWENTAAAIDTGGSVPTTLFLLTTNPPGRVVVEGVDLSAVTGTIFGAASEAAKSLTLKDCKLNASVTIAATQTGINTGAVEVLRCDSGAKAYRAEKYNALGSQAMEATITRTSGASVGGTGLSANLTTTSQAAFAFPFEGLPLTINNSTTAVSKTATVEGVWNAAALPDNGEFWIDVEYLGSAASPLGSFASGGKADGLAAGVALTASTSAWDANVTARANSTTYAVGNVRKVASNPGRIFFVTAQSGASAASEPAGFATAVDGGSVTDGGVTWRAGVRFKQAVSFTAQMAGAVFVYPKAGKASSTFYIDPVPTLS